MSEVPLLVDPEGQTGTSASALADLPSALLNWKLRSLSGSDDLERRGRVMLAGQIVVLRGSSKTPESLELEESRFDLHGTEDERRTAIDWAQWHGDDSGSGSGSGSHLLVDESAELDLLRLSKSKLSVESNICLLWYTLACNIAEPDGLLDLSKAGPKLGLLLDKTLPNRCFTAGDMGMYPGCGCVGLFDGSIIK